MKDYYDSIVNVCAGICGVVLILGIIVLGVTGTGDPESVLIMLVLSVLPFGVVEWWVREGIFDY